MKRVIRFIKSCMALIFLLPLIPIDLVGFLLAGLSDIFEWCSDKCGDLGEALIRIVDRIFR